VSWIAKDVETEEAPGCGVDDELLDAVVLVDAAGTIVTVFAAVTTTDGAALALIIGVNEPPGALYHQQSQPPPSFEMRLVKGHVWPPSSETSIEVAESAPKTPCNQIAVSLLEVDVLVRTKVGVAVEDVAAEDPELLLGGDVPVVELPDTVDVPAAALLDAHASTAACKPLSAFWSAA
jgi:hypothetical protein